MKDDDLGLRVNVLLSFQRALIGMIYPSIRGIAVGYDGLKKLKVKCYLDRIPNEQDYENMTDITVSVFADIEFESEEIQCIYSKDNISDFGDLIAWVYFRREDFSYYPLLA